MSGSNIYILGDICPRWSNEKQFDTKKAQEVFHEIIDLLKSSELVIANLECPATDCEEKLPKNSVNLKSKPFDISVLAEAGIHGVSIANNHILDYGVDGYFDTVQNIEANGMFCYGAGNLLQCGRPMFRQLEGRTIGMLAFAEREFNCAVDYGVGANLWDDLESISAIRMAKEQCDYLIVQYHGGIEEYIYPSPVLQKKCRAMVEAGADFVTCQHSHCVGTREKWNGAEILYGQGNCVFGFEEGNDQWNTGLIVEVSFDEGRAKVNYLPIEATLDGIHFMKTNKAESYLQQFWNHSDRIGDARFIRRKWNSFCEKQKDNYLPTVYAYGRVLNKINRLTKGCLIRLFTKRTSRRNSMNLVRCDAHREVLTTVQEMDYYEKIEGREQ